MNKTFKWTAIISLGVFLFYATVHPTNFTDNLSVLLAVVIFGAIFGIPLVMVSAFAVVDAVRYGNPFHTVMGTGETDPRKAPPKIFVVEQKENKKKVCPICKRKTRCHVKWAPGLRAYIHVRRD
jgi:hypothetical protein